MGIQLPRKPGRNAKLLPAGELGGSRQRHHNDDGDDDDDEGGDFYHIVGMMAEDAVDYDEKPLTCQLYPDCLINAFCTQ